jgi:hypothetical protein
MVTYIVCKHTRLSPQWAKSMTNPVYRILFMVRALERGTV